VRLRRAGRVAVVRRRAAVVVVHGGGSPARRTQTEVLAPPPLVGGGGREIASVSIGPSRGPGLADFVVDGKKKQSRAWAPDHEFNM